MSGRSPRWIEEVQWRKLPVSLTGTLSSSYAYVTIDFEKYSDEAELEIEEKTVIEITVSGSSHKMECEITLNGEIVQSGNGTYSMTVTKPITISFAKGNYAFYTCSITTNDG